MFTKLASLLDVNHAHLPHITCIIFAAYYVRGDTDDHGRSLNAAAALSWALAWPGDTTCPGQTGLDLWRPPSGHPAAARMHTLHSCGNGSRRAIVKDACATPLPPP